MLSCKVQILTETICEHCQHPRLVLEAMTGDEVIARCEKCNHRYYVSPTAPGRARDLAELVLDVQRSVRGALQRHRVSDLWVKPCDGSRSPRYQL